MGLDALAVPLFRIEPIEWQAPEPAGFDGLLLTSANAVRHGGDQLETLRGLPVYAVGEASAEAARAAGFDIAGSGEAGVERLLGSIDGGLRLLHLCGEHRMAVEATQAITAVPVYRSAELPAPAGLARIAGQTAAVHSPRAGRRLAELVDEAGVDRSTIRIAAISDAAVAAMSGGWDACEAAERPDDRALLALAARLCDCYGR
jgi:uroporphyrinogen-III synthase